MVTATQIAKAPQSTYSTMSVQKTSVETQDVWAHYDETVFLSLGMVIVLVIFCALPLWLPFLTRKKPGKPKK